MRVQKLPLRFLVITFCLAIISLTFSFQTIHSQQVKPLTLAQILLGLQSKSGGFTLAQKNSHIIKRVQQYGVTFRLIPDFENELRQAGASAALLRAIRLKSPRTTPTPRTNIPNDEDKPNATYEKIWVQENVVEDGVKGIRILANFSVYNLKGVKSDIVYRLEKDGVLLKGSNPTYRTTTGDLSARRYLTPAYSATVYEELAAFLPYKEINLAPGVHNLKLDADVIKRDGTVVKHLTLQDLRLVIPSTTPTLRKTGSATFGDLWIDYNVTQNGQVGMMIHVKLTISSMKDEDAYVQLLFEKQDGTKLYSSNTTYKSPDGQTAVYRSIRPLYESTNFNDISLFIPYKEFNLPVGKHDIKIHADVIYPDYSMLQHLTYKPFVYTRSK